MAINWGYSPKVEKYIPLGDFPADQYLVIARQAIENLGWKLSHLSESGIIAYTGISLQSYSEEISITIRSNFAIFKSECIGVQLLFTDYGKNDENLDKFFHEFEYIEYHFKDSWKERLEAFHDYAASQDDAYLDRAPLKTKDKIKNVLYLFYPQKNYWVTPVLIDICIFYFLVMVVAAGIVFYKGVASPEELVEKLSNFYLDFGANSRDKVLSGEFWRLISGMFMHFSLSHLFFNMYALVYIGLMTENKLGSYSFAAIYLLSGICGSILSVYTHHIGIMVGASGAIMGMFGAFLALLLSNAFEKSANKALLISTLILVAYMLLNGLTTKGVDNSAHFGGAISGFIIGYLLFNARLFGQEISIWYRALASFWLVVGLGLAVYFGSPNYQILEYAKLKWEFNKNDNDFYQVYNLSNSMSREEQLALVKRYGIGISEQNLQVVKKMQKLVLTDRDRLDLGYRKIVAQKEYRASMLMYKDIKSGSRDNRTEIQDQVSSLNELKLELADKLKEMEH
jgi:rhomboid protease GluP